MTPEKTWEELIERATTNDNIRPSDSPAILAHDAYTKELKGKSCRAREALEYIAREEPPKYSFCDDNLTRIAEAEKFYRHILDVAKRAALSSTGPCPHEEELGRLNFALDEMERAYPPDIFTEPTPDDFAHVYKVRGLSERLHGSWGRHLVEVIRRQKEGL